MFQIQFSGCHPQLPFSFQLQLTTLGDGENVLSILQAAAFWRRGHSGETGPWWLNPLGYEPKGLAAAPFGDVYTKKGITSGVGRGQSTDAASATET